MKLQVVSYFRYNFNDINSIVYNDIISDMIGDMIGDISSAIQDTYIIEMICKSFIDFYNLIY